VIPIWLAVLAVVFAMFVGIVSGLYPARRATKIKALEAMRTES
jgi:ABC-type antimicrobial peptide transport system permease subunit